MSFTSELAPLVQRLAEISQIRMYVVGGWVHALQHRSQMELGRPKL